MAPWLCPIVRRERTPSASSRAHPTHLASVRESRGCVPDRVRGGSAASRARCGVTVDYGRSSRARRRHGPLAPHPASARRGAGVDASLAEGDDAGFFGPGSAVWAVNGALPTLVAGIRALLLQTLHPGAMAGVHDWSRYNEDPLGRLDGTVRWVAMTTFGDRRSATAASAFVSRLHERVTAPTSTPRGRAQLRRERRGTAALGARRVHRGVHRRPRDVRRPDPRRPRRVRAGVGAGGPPHGRAATRRRRSRPCTTRWRRSSSRRNPTSGSRPRCSSSAGPDCRASPGGSIRSCSAAPSPRSTRATANCSGSVGPGGRRSR